MTRAQYGALCLFALVLGALLAAILPERSTTPDGRVYPLGSSGWALVGR